MRQLSSLCSIEQAVDDIRNGRMIVVVDDDDRECSGHLVMAAQLVNPDAINFMARHACGLVCLALSPDMADKLHLPLMPSSNAGHTPAFTVSIEAREGVTTGISAADRATTILAAVAENAGPDDIVTPGHVFPLRARRGGVLTRVGIAEAGSDLAAFAGLRPAAVHLRNPQG